MKLRGLTRKGCLAVVRAECPPDAEGFQDDILAHLERVIAGSPLHIRVAARASFRLVALTVFPRRIGRMPPERLSSHLLRLRHSRFAVLREAAAGARALVLFAYFEQPRVHARLGYDPEGWTRKVLDRREAAWGVRRGVPGEDAPA